MTLGRLHPSLLPALAVAVLPKCPMCWAAWASAAASLGLGRPSYVPWLLPMAVAVLVGALAAGAWRGWRHQGTTAVLFLLGGALVIGGRLVFDHPPTLYAGLFILVAAQWRSYTRPKKCCPG